MCYIHILTFRNDTKFTKKKQNKNLAEKTIYRIDIFHLHILTWHKVLLNSKNHLFHFSQIFFCASLRESHLEIFSKKSRKNFSEIAKIVPDFRDRCGMKKVQKTDIFPIQNCVVSSCDFYLTIENY